MSSFERLDAAPVMTTVARLESRIRARFPDRGLCRVAGELRVLIDDVAAGASAIRGRLRWVRLGSRVAAALVLVATIAVFVLAFRDAVRLGPEKSFEWVPLIESAINDLVCAGLALWFLYALPQRLERGHLLDLDRAQMEHYLDYCSELLSLVGKGRGTVRGGVARLARAHDRQ